MVYLGDGWGEVVLPSPGSEPPPPYSPPRVPHHHHQHFFPEAFTSSSSAHHLHQHHHHIPSHHYCHNHISDYYDLSPTRSSQPSSLSHNVNGARHHQDNSSNLLDTKLINDPPPPYPPSPFKSTHPALNHGPSSAFSPPTKSIKYSYPPPYTPKDMNCKSEDILNNQCKGPQSLLSTSNVNNMTHNHYPHPPSSLPSDLSSNISNGGSSNHGSNRSNNECHDTDAGFRHRSRRSHQYPQDNKSRSLEHHRGVNGNNTEVRSSSGSRGHHSSHVTSPNEKIGSTNGIGVINNHPKGPLLKTGKSLELPNKRLFSSSYHHSNPASTSSSSHRRNHLHPNDNQHPSKSHSHHHSQRHHRIPPTAHVHPGHTSHPSHHPTKDIHPHHTKEPLGNFSKSNKLAYVGILPSKKNPSNCIKDKPTRVFAKGRDYHHPCDRSREHAQLHHQQQLIRNDDRWARRTSKLEAAAAKSMMPVRAMPVTAVPGQGVPVNSMKPDMCDYEISLGRGRLRSCRSLDELSDLLDEDLPRLPVATTRSLDDLTEPLYENVEVINAHARDTHNARLAHNTSVPDLLEPPPRPPRQRNNSLSSLLDDLAQCGANTALSRRHLNTSVPDVLERGLGTGGRDMGVLSWCSPTSTLRSGTSTLQSNTSNTSTLRSNAQDPDNTSDIGVQLQKIREVARVLGVKYRNGELSSSSGASSGPPSTHTSPRMPSHAHQVQMQAPGVPSRAPVIHDVLRDGRKASPQQLDADVASQESGYSSMDSRTCRQLQQQQQKHYLQSSQQQKSLQFSPERPIGSPRHQLDSHFQHQYQQPFSIQDNRHTQYSRTQSPDYLGQDRTSVEKSLKHSQKQQNNSVQSNTTSRSSQYQPKHRDEYINKSSLKSSPEEVSSVNLPKDNSLQGRNSSSALRHHSRQLQQDSNYNDQQSPSSMQAHQGVVGQKIHTQQGVNQDKLGIYIKSVVPGGAADQDGRLQAGDQLLTVDGKSLIGITQERAAEYMMETGPVVTLEVARQGAIYHGLATILSQPSPQANRGYPGGRHLSERDLPSKVLREHHQEPPTHPHQAPRMQSSKSVPSLNSEGNSSVVGGKTSSLEVFNPSYSRTSSNTSLSQPPNSHVSHHQHHHLQQQQQHHQQQQQPIRSRSTQNLSDGNYQGAVGRHPSNPSLVVEEERYYQNVNFHQGAQDPRMGSTRTRPAQPLPLGSPASQGAPEQGRQDHFRGDPRGDHRPASAFMQREDMMAHRNELQRPASQRDIRADAKMMEMTEEVRRREDRMRLNGHAPNGPQHRSGPHQSHQRAPNASSYPPFSPEGYGGQQGYPGQQHPEGYHPAVSQPLASPQGHQGPPHHGHPQYAGQPQHGFQGKHPPPTAPKPKGQGVNPLSPEAPEKPSRQLGYDGMGAGYDGPPRPPPPEDGYRDSPPPPPPPTSTHPLLQTGGSRPTSSVGHNSNQFPNKSPFNATSPWAREEKDRNDRRRREAVRHWRDEQITSLEAIDMRTSQQDERLRTLRLEKEFQRRAEEALTNEDDEDDDDNDEEEDEEAKDNDNEDSSRHIHDSMMRDDNKLNSHGPIIPMGQEPRMNGGGPADDVRARRVDEIRRKQQELEAASEVEERLLREAQRRQQEEHLRQKQQHAAPAPSQHMHYQHQHHATQRLDSLVATPFQPQYSNGPVNGMAGGGVGSGFPEHTTMPIDTRNRMDTVPSGAQKSPVPPERGSSYSIMQHQPPTTPSNSRIKGSSETSSATIKRVQFSEAPATVETHITYDSNANQEKTPQDPNNFINEAETLLNSSPTRNVVGTPGVIGAQEVYRDPRMRRLQQKQAEQAAAKNPGPEKLTFKEKMKMFAMETGEGETPKDKVKISRAQRDLEH